ncbi:GNAT family N-acetyltransferase [Bacillus salitolerans]|uniref:GNAT family N-acetyltransferase n=1 Tax=Bacillus salitolerans TaxID=1437434 RepID=A0ABW4LRV6_9BACI
MKQVTFENIYTPAQIVLENDLYKHFHFPEMLLRYDSNFIDFKKMPSIEEFMSAASYLREYHVKNGQKHVKFTFPENEKLHAPLEEYLRSEEYSIGYLELYSINPSQFPELDEKEDIEVKVVSDDNFEEFLALQYKQDLQFGSEFADQKVRLYKRYLQDSKIVQLLAYYKGVPAGTVNVIVEAETVEIDDLAVSEAYQKRGIGSRLQKAVMNIDPTKLVILVADGEDTPREMYQRQNYQYHGFKYNTQKVYEDK